MTCIETTVIQSNEDVVSPKAITKVELKSEPTEVIIFSDNHNLDEYIIGK